MEALGPGLCSGSTAIPTVTACSHRRPRQHALALRPRDDTTELGLPAGTGSPGSAPTSNTSLMHKNILFPHFEINALHAS